MWCAGNNKVVGCNSVGVVVYRAVVVLWIVWYLVGWVVDRVRGWENERTLSRALPNEKRSFYNGILTVAPISIIQFTVYSTVKTVYQIEPKKIG